MKKLLTVLALGALLASSSFAEFAVGVRGSLGISDAWIADDTKHQIGNSISSGLTDASYSVDNEAVLCGGGAVWGTYSFKSLPALALQTEIGLLFNNGTKVTGEAKSGTKQIEMEDTFSYSSLELPFLVTFTVNKGGFFEFTPQAGIYLSFPISKIKQEMDAKGKLNGVTVTENSSERSDDLDNAFIFGTAFGADFAFNFSKKSALVLNARYMIDLGELKSNDENLGTRRVFLMSAGYRYTFR